MRKIILDTNIIFSAFLNLDSKFGQIIINGYKYYQFYSPQYVRQELIKHREKIKKLAHLKEAEFIETYELLLRRIEIISHSIISLKSYNRAEKLCHDIDVDDTAFVALNIYLRAKLWTGDKSLINGLKQKGYKQIITTEDLYSDYLQKRKRDNK